MDYKKYLKDINAQKQINRFVKKFKNKKIVLYGAGLFANAIIEVLDLSKLNIIAICDKKYSEAQIEDNFTYEHIAPEELDNLDYDVLLLSVLDYECLLEKLKNTILKNSKKTILPLIEPNLFYNFVFTLKKSLMPTQIDTIERLKHLENELSEMKTIISNINFKQNLLMDYYTKPADA